MHETVERLRQELAEAVGGMTIEQTQVHPQPGKWNVQQIVEHLILSYETTAEVVMARVGKGTPTKASPSVQQRLGQIMIVELRVFPKGRLSPAAVAPQEVPERVTDGDELGASVGEALRRMDGALVVAAELFGESQRAVSHLVLGPMSVRQWRLFHLVHGRHHLEQIAAIPRVR